MPDRLLPPVPKPDRFFNRPDASSACDWTRSRYRTRHCAATGRNPSPRLKGYRRAADASVDAATSAATRRREPRHPPISKGANKDDASRMHRRRGEDHNQEFLLHKYPTKRWMSYCSHIVKGRPTRATVISHPTNQITKESSDLQGCLTTKGASPHRRSHKPTGAHGNLGTQELPCMHHRLSSYFYADVNSTISRFHPGPLMAKNM